MKEEFSVLYDRTPVGKAEVIRQGLYHRISCRYRLSSGEVCRLIVKWPGGWENIGIPVPEGEGFLLVKMVPVKKIPEADVSFHLIPAQKDPAEADHRKDTGASETQVMHAEVPQQEPVDEETKGPERRPIREDMPFSELDRLENARLDAEDGQAYAVFEDGISELQPEPDGTVVRAEDIGVDGSGEDAVPESV